MRDPAPKEDAPRPAAAPAADPLPPPPSMPPPPAKKAEAEIDRAKVSSSLHNGFVVLLSSGDPAPKHGHNEFKKLCVMHCRKRPHGEA